MSIGLEKLKTIRHIHDMECGKDESINKDFDIIEKELEDLDTIKEIFSWYGLEYKLTIVREALLLLKQYQGSYGVRGQALITKKLKAFEIIKEKEINVFIFLHSGDLETYNDMVEDNRKLSQEEYDLLKEVLL